MVRNTVRLGRFSTTMNISDHSLDVYHTMVVLGLITCIEVPRNVGVNFSRTAPPARLKFPYFQNFLHSKLSKFNTMAAHISKKRKLADGMKGQTKRPTKKFKKQTEYHSSSSEDEVEIEGTAIEHALELKHADGDQNDELSGEGEGEGLEGIAEDVKPAVNDSVASNSKLTTKSTPNIGDDEGPSEAEEDYLSDSNSDSENDSQSSNSSHPSNPNTTKLRKRNDPTAFSTSMSKILSSKLSLSKRPDPILSRSVTALQASNTLTEQTLEKKARHKLREEKKKALEKGRVRDVLGVGMIPTSLREGGNKGEDNAEGSGERESAREIMEMEKRLRKTAQRGVVKLFNAVRAAQVKGEEAAREARKGGVVGLGKREEKVEEMSKRGFLELIAGGGGGLRMGEIEEA